MKKSLLTILIIFITTVSIFSLNSKYNTGDILNFYFKFSPIISELFPTKTKHFLKYTKPVEERENGIFYNLLYMGSAQKDFHCNKWGINNSNPYCIYIEARNINNSKEKYYVNLSIFDTKSDTIYIFYLSNHYFKYNESFIIAYKTTNSMKEYNDVTNNIIPKITFDDLFENKKIATELEEYYKEPTFIYIYEKDKFIKVLNISNYEQEILLLQKSDKEKYLEATKNLRKINKYIKFNRFQLSWDKNDEKFIISKKYLDRFL